MAEQQIGRKVMGTIKSVKGHCNAGHKVGDQFELSIHKTSGLCGSFYHTIFPYITMLQFGGSFPKEWGGTTMVLECIDKYNAVTIELRLAD